MQTADFIVLGLYLITLCIMTWCLRKTSSRPGEFFLAGRRLGAVPVGLSVMVTTFSAVNYLALPGEVCGYGLYVLASLPVFFLAAWPVTRIWMPYLLKHRSISVYAFLEERFDLRVRLLASGIFLVWRLFWMGVALYASCRIMAALTGLRFMTLLLTAGIAATGYSAIGGMRAVVWTDVMQFIVLFGSICLGVYLAWNGADFRGILLESGRLKPFYPVDWSYFSPDPRLRITFWSAILGTWVAFLTRFGADQMVMQRYLAASSLEAARRGLWLNGAVSVLALGLLALFGLAVHVFVRRNGLDGGMPPVQAVAIMLRSFPAGATGLVGAGLLAATMSSIDSGLNSCTAAVTADFLPHIPRWRPSPRTLTILLAVPVMAFAAWVLPELNRSNTLFMILNKSVNAMGTPLLAVMLAALFRKKVSTSAVFYGTLTGFILTILAGIFIRGLALHYYAVLSLVLTIGAITAYRQLYRVFSSQYISGK